jgi:hypothetical protein
MRLRFSRVALAVVLAAAIVASKPRQAGAETCSSDGCHEYSAAWSYSSGDGLFGQWQDTNMYLTSSMYNHSGHITAEMWADGPGGRWLETGLLNSANLWGQNPCGCTAYQQFWADYNGSVFGFHWIANISPDGATHSYELLRVPRQNLWNVYLDWSYVDVSGGLLSTFSTLSIAGLEWDQGTQSTGSPLTPSSHSDGFDAITQVHTVSSGWFYPSWSGQYFDRPCGPYPNGYCLNGTSYGTGQWSYNKP